MSNKFKKLEKRGWTPGPWSIGNRSEHGTQVLAHAQVAFCGIAGRFGAKTQIVEEHEANRNAQLIAAAPDLYEENQRLLAVIENLEFFIEQDEAESIQKDINLEVFESELKDLEALCCEYATEARDLERQVNQLGEALREAIKLNWIAIEEYTDSASKGLSVPSNAILPMRKLEKVAHALNDSGQWRASK